MNPADYDIDLTSVKSSLGVEDSVDSMTYLDLQERRDLIRKRLGGKPR